MSKPSLYKGQIFVATAVDHAFLTILMNSLSEVVGEFDPSAAERFRPELRLALEVLYYTLSIRAQATPAMLTCGLVFDGGISGTLSALQRPAASKSGSGSSSDGVLTTTSTAPIISSTAATAAVLCAVLLCQWMLQRVQLTALMQRWRSLPEDNVRKKMWRLAQAVDLAVRIGGLANVLRFCATGSFPSLLLRVCNLHMVRQEQGQGVGSGNTGVSSVEVQYRHRRLLWAALASTATVAATALNYQQAYAQAVDFAHFVARDVRLRATPSSSADPDSGHGSSGADAGEGDAGGSGSRWGGGWWDWILRPFAGSSSRRGSRGTGRGSDPGPGTSAGTEACSARHRGPSKCALCHRCPAEDPHRSRSCAHVYCYVCIYCAAVQARCGDFDALLLTGTSSPGQSASAQSGSAGNRTSALRLRCPECHASIAGLQRLADMSADKR